MQRVFFDWSRPFLPQVASFVVSQETARLQTQSLPQSPHSTSNAAPLLSFDLGDLVFILPGRRATRTLEAYLQLEVERAIRAGSIAPDWTPPTYLTVGAAPEFLYPPRKRVAARPTRLLCMRRALREFSNAEPEKSRALIKSLPAESNWAAQLELAQIFVDLADELASENRDFSAVAASTQRRGLPEETERWESLGRLAALYRKELARFDLTDLNLARTAALLSGEIGVSVGGGFENGASKRYIVVGAVDLNRQQKAIFEALGDKISFFVFAPESLQDRFDEFGVVVPEAWERSEIPIPDRRFFQVDGPVEQGQAAALLVRELSKVPVESDANVENADADDAPDWRYEPIPADSLTIGVPDPEVVPFLERSLRDVGYATIRAQGSPTTQNRVFQLLRNVADYLETRSFSALEELARRSDVEEYLIRNWRFVSLDDGRSNAEEAEEAAVAPGSALDEAEEGVWFDDELPPDFGDDAPFDEDAELADDALNINEAENAEPLDSDAPETPFVPGDWLSEFDRYRATFLPTRVDGRWFEYKNEDAPRQNAEFRLLRKVALLIDRALEPFCDSQAPPLQREKIAAEPTFKRSSVDAETGDLDALKLDVADFKSDETDDVFSGPLAFAKDDFAESFRWKTNQRRLPIADWAPILSNFLCKIYPEPEPGARTSEAAAQVDAFFAAINQEFDKFEAIPQELTADATGADAIRTILKELAKTTIPPFPGADVVELQGWLDLAFDDAPNLILTGFNEGVVPSSKSSDLFLPNETRRELGLEDARRRFARDACLTSALAASKRNFFVVLGRRSLQNDPKTPSRFAFATAPENVPPRICRFFGSGSNDLAELEARQLGRPFPKAPVAEDVENADSDTPETPIQTTSTETAETVLAVGTPSPTPSQPTRPVGFSVPILRTTGPAPSKMKVTEFRDFLACPYRYFLRRALNLRAAAPETTAEMNAAAFGTLAHDALRDFGLAPEIRDSVDADAISAWLSERLDLVASRYFNELSSPFVRVQIEQIRSRLDAFARWQALWRRSGRQIKFVEAAPRSGSITFDVGGGRPVEIFGRLDRIDYDPKANRWFVFDYKTFDTAKEGRASKEPISEFAPDAFDDETQTALFTTRLGNVADDKHRRRAKPRLSTPLRTLEKFGITPAPNVPETVPSSQSAPSAALDEETGPTFDWVDLQLPLYRRFFREILFEYYDGDRSREDLEETKVALGYVVLTKGAKTQAFGGPWTERDLRSADATAARVVRTIRRLWNAPIDPNAYLDPNDPSLGTLLNPKAPAFSEDLSPITLDYLTD